MSFDGINFTSLKKVAASDYTQWPTNYYAGFHKIYLSATKVYYRIKTVFSDSAFSYGSPSVFSVATGNHQVSYASLH